MEIKDVMEVFMTMPSIMQLTMQKNSKVHIHTLDTMDTVVIVHHMERLKFKLTKIYIKAQQQWKLLLLMDLFLFQFKQTKVHSWTMEVELLQIVNALKQDLTMLF